ncbi:MAG: Hsp20 family protein [Alphaproteobacteria bacterium]|nr:Hsp20 family protein [Alphaproteobacteria bacterium]
MNTFDLTPLFRSSIGFDRLERMLDAASSQTEMGGYPPYNIEKTDDDAYRITLAVAGFNENDIEIESHNNELTVIGRNSDEDDNREYLYKGIAGRNFLRKFQLADHVKVTGANLSNGLLNIDLVREVPEEMKPRKIAIKSGQNGSNKKLNVE